MQENDAIGAYEEMLARGMRTLSRRDPALRPLIKGHGMPTFRPHANYFDTLVNSIISQQISGSAAQSIKRKLLDALGGTFDPRLIADVPDELLRGAGISPQKLGYLRSLAEHFLDGRLRAEELPALPDEEVIRELTDIKGIGVWTAHMFMMFSLGRLDVLPMGDLGVQRGVQITYGLETLPKPRQVEAIALEKGWAPYRSLASWYMWRACET